MAKTVFRPNEIKKSEEQILLQLARKFAVEETIEEITPEPVYEGPTVDDLRREADQWRAQWEREKADMIAEAQEEAASIRKDAETAAFEEVKRKTDQSQVIRQQAQGRLRRRLQERS